MSKNKIQIIRTMEVRKDFSRYLLASGPQYYIATTYPNSEHVFLQKEVTGRVVRSKRILAAFKALLATGA